MEEYKPPKMFPKLREMVDEKIAQPTAEGGWKKLKKGPKNVQIENAVPVAPKIATEKVQSSPLPEGVHHGRSDFLPGDQFFLNKSSFSNHEAPDFEVKSVDRDGNIISLEKGAKQVSVDSPDKFARIIGTDDGVKYDEIGKSKDDKAYGRGLLEKLNRVDVLSIEGEGNYDTSDNEVLQLTFLMSRQHLKEMVIAYEKKLAERQDASLDLQEIVAYSKTILEIFSFGKEDDNSPEIKGKKKVPKPRQKKMRLNDEEGRRKTVNTKGGGRVQKSQVGRDVTQDVQEPVVDSPTVSEGVPIDNRVENGNGESDPIADFRYLLVNAAAPIDTQILNAHNREDISFISLRTLPDGMKVFIEMTEQNGLKKIYKQLIDRRKKSEAFKLKQEWIAENHRLEMSYLKQSLIVEILAVGADTMERIDTASNSKAMQSIGRIVRTKDSEERIFIPTDPGISQNDPSGTEGIRMAIQNIIEAWRAERVPKKYRGNNFEAYFKQEFSPLITDSNKQIREFWEKKRATFSKEKSKNPFRREKKNIGEKLISTERMDMIALEQSALQSAERYFTDEAIPIIEETMRDAGVDLIWLLSEGEENERVLDFVLKEVGVNIVTLASRYTGQLVEEKRAAFEQKIRDAAKNILTELIIGKISRMLESKSSGR